MFGTDILRIEELEPAKKVQDRMLGPLALGQDIMDMVYGGTAARLLKLKV